MGEFSLPDGGRAVPVFQLMAERYLGGEYAPAQVAERCGIPAETISRIAAEIANVAFDQELVLDQPWTDTAGRRHEKMVGRPVAMHAMRGISAHSNGFQTCRAIHLLQMLLGAVDTPGIWRYKSPYPKPIPPRTAAGRARQHAQPRRCPAWRSASRAGRRICCSTTTAGRSRIDKAFSWDAPLAAHGMMHMVIGNAAAGDPYPIDTLFMYMANMALELLDEPRRGGAAC